MGLRDFIRGGECGSEADRLRAAGEEVIPPGQLRVLIEVLSWWDEKGYAPGVRDLCKRLGIRNTNGVVGHLTGLEKKGLIRRVRGHGRTVVPLVRLELYEAPPASTRKRRASASTPV